MDRKNAIVLTVIATVTLLVAMVGATFAYFTAQTGAGQSADITVTTSTSDSLEYGTFGAIVINATQENFGKDMGNLSGTTTGKVTLKANNDAAAEFCYTASLNVSSNNLEYTVDEQTPELTFSATKNSTELVVDADITVIEAGDNAVRIPTSLNGSDYTHKISAEKGETTTDDWTGTVTLINLDTDQEDNTYKTFIGTLKFTTVECQ